MFMCQVEGRWCTDTWKRYHKTLAVYSLATLKISFCTLLRVQSIDGYNLSSIERPSFVLHELPFWSTTFCQISCHLILVASLQLYHFTIHATYWSSLLFFVLTGICITVKLEGGMNCIQSISKLHLTASACFLLWCKWKYVTTSTLV